MSCLMSARARSARSEDITTLDSAILFFLFHRCRCAHCFSFLCAAFRSNGPEELPRVWPILHRLAHFRPRPVLIECLRNSGRYVSGRVIVSLFILLPRL
ncbi:hypothetical protein M433DRAFT_286687 [Acidomyces richmondensis BFW]|nr:hypothetical protein M433DRAFT_286687 [Acidomyces richmondensis BFW]